MDALTLQKINSLNSVPLKTAFAQNFMESMNKCVENGWKLKGKQPQMLNKIYSEHFEDTATPQAANYPNSIAVKPVNGKYGITYEGSIIGTPQDSHDDAEYLAQWLSDAINQILDINNKQKGTTVEQGNTAINNEYPETWNENEDDDF